MPFKRYTAQVKARAVRQYEEGKTSVEIAKALGACDRTVLRWIRAAGVTVRPRGATPTSPYTAKTKKQAVRLYVSGKPSTEVAKEMGMSTTAVLKWVREAGETVRKGGPPTHYIFSDEEKDRAVSLYLSGQSSTAVAKAVGVRPDTVRIWIRRAGQKLRTRKSGVSAVWLPSQLVDEVNRLAWEERVTSLAEWLSRAAKKLRTSESRIELEK